jgi:hypothetical protein
MSASSSTHLVLAQSRRSTLHLLPDGAHMARRYHDTGAWSDPMPVWTSARARACLAACRLGERGADFRGASTEPGLGRPPPPHLRNALASLCREPRGIAQLAALCEVQPATAWSYACRVVETWPNSHSLAARLVAPDVLASVRAADDLSGSLRDLSSRLAVTDPRYGGSPEVRGLADRYAHLRLARVCVEAERREGVDGVGS